MTTAHLVDICEGMKIVGFNKTPGESRASNLPTVVLPAPETPKIITIIAD
jgi:hypothetical protein